MAMPSAASGVGSVIAFKAEDISGLTQTLNGLLATYNEVNNNFISLMDSIVGSDAFAGASAAAAGEISTVLHSAQITANEKFNNLILGINNASNAATETDAANAANINQGV